MTTDTHSLSGTETPAGTGFPSDTAAEHDTPSRRNVPGLSLPGMPFSMDPKRLLWYGGLAALATVGVLEWPVAAVVGVGSYVAERMARDDALRAVRQRP